MGASLAVTPVIGARIRIRACLSRRTVLEDVLELSVAEEEEEDPAGDGRGYVGECDGEPRTAGAEAGYGHEQECDDGTNPQSSR